MAEYIEREAVHDLVQSLTKYAWASPGNTGHRVTVDADDVDFGVDKIPSANVAPVRHGRWITKQEKDTFAGYLYSYECSECGRVEQCKEPYCNCGAKMDLKGEDHED